MDILLAVLLTIHNKKLALARGRKPGGFIALTLVLCFGFEFIAYFIALDIYGISATALYDVENSAKVLIASVIGLAAAGLGGLIAYIAVKSCKPGDYYPVSPMAGYRAMPPAGGPFMAPAQPLDAPATIEIVRDYSMRGDITSWKFILNGETVGNLGNGATRSAATQQRQNTLRAVSEDGREYAPLQFDIESGGHAEIHFKGDRFERESCTGILPQSCPAAPPPMQYAPPVMLRTEPLTAPATLKIVRDSHQDSPSTVWSFMLNGYPLGAIADGQAMTIATIQQQNMLRALPANGIEPPPMMFCIQSGGTAEIHFKNGAFLPEESGGILPLNVPPMYAPYPYAPPYNMAPPYMAGGSPAQPEPAPEKGTTCPRCGAPVRWTDQYCVNCGEKQPGAEKY